MDPIRGVVRLEPGETKSGEGRTIPLAPQLLEILEIQRARANAAFPSCPFVCPDPQERLSTTIKIV
jgi:integrase